MHTRARRVHKLTRYSYGEFGKRFFYMENNNNILIFQVKKVN